LAFAFAGFTALAMAAISWTLETSESYWFWHRYYKLTLHLSSLSFSLSSLPHLILFLNVYSIWHITIYTSSFFFLCSKIEDSETPVPTDGNYELTHQDSLPRSG